MRVARVVIILFSLAVCMVSCSEPPFVLGNYGVRRTEGIAYRFVGSRTMRLDMTQPRRLTAKSPAIVYVHGPAQSRRVFRLEQARQSQRGYVTISIDYTESFFPASGVSDIRSAVRWLRGHAEEYGIDSRRIAIVGYSTGANRAMIAVMSSSDDEIYGDPDHPGVPYGVSAIVNISGEPYYHDRDDLRDEFGATYEDAPERYNALGVAGALGRDMPPILTITGGSMDPTMQEHRLLSARIRSVQGAEIWIVREGFSQTLSLMDFDMPFDPVDQFLDTCLVP